MTETPQMSVFQQPPGMIDLHIHILPGLDDGAKSLEESLRMCQLSYQDGVKTIVATPHTGNGHYHNPRATVLQKVEELSEALNECGIRNAEFGIRNPEPNIRSEIPGSQIEMESGLVHSAFRIPHPALDFGSLQSSIINHHSSIPLRVLPGADAHFCPEIVRLVEEGEIETVNDNERFLMVEFPSQGIPFRAEDVLFQLMVKRITPIITHPERNLEIGQKPRRYYEMIKMGCLGQVTAMSLTGGFGLEVKRVAENLLRHRLIHFIASDAHSANGRPPMLSPAVKAAAKIVGEEAAWKMVTEYPGAVLEGRRPRVREPKAIK
jgi:protein-tyrosine phosphatase